MNKQTIYKKAIEKWGNSLQICMAIEEMSELTKELIKFFRGKKDLQISEEIADVEIMLEQLKVMFKNHNEIRTIKIKKIKRLANLLKS